MSGYIVQICVSHDPIKPKAWLAASSDDAASVVYDRTCARVFETAEEAHSAAVQYRKSKRASRRISWSARNAEPLQRTTDFPARPSFGESLRPWQTRASEFPHDFRRRIAPSGLDAL